MAKLCGEDKPLGIADWAKNRQAELIKLLGLERQSMPNHNTYRRILAYVIYEDEIERLVGEYNQEGEHGEVYAMDGKAIRGMQKKDESISEYALSVCDVKQGKVLSQVQVGRKENEISRAPEALKLVKIAGKVVTGDAMHTQKRLSTQILEGHGDFVFPVKENQGRLYKSIQELFAPEYPRPGFGKIQTDFQTAQKVIKVMVVLKSAPFKLAKCSTPILVGRGWHKSIAWNAPSNIGVAENVIGQLAKEMTRPKASASRLLEIRRAHWGIEAGLHYRRDITLKEDATRMTVGNTGIIMASINNLVLALIQQAKFYNAAQARRWFAANLSMAFTLLTTPSLLL